MEERNNDKIVPPSLPFSCLPPPPSPTFIPVTSHTFFYLSARLLHLVPIHVIVVHSTRALSSLLRIPLILHWWVLWSLVIEKQPIAEAVGLPMNQHDFSVFLIFFLIFHIAKISVT